MLKKSLIALGVAAAFPAVSFADIVNPIDLDVPEKTLELLYSPPVSWTSDKGTHGNQSVIGQDSSYNYALVDQDAGYGDSDSLIFQGGYGANLAVVEQDGSDVNSIIDQTGFKQKAFTTMSNGDVGSNSRIQQRGGEYNYADVTIDGDENNSVVLQDHAWGAEAEVVIWGEGNTSNVYQGGISNTGTVSLSGNKNVSTMHQWGDFNTSTTNVTGNKNRVTSEQDAWSSDINVEIVNSDKNKINSNQFGSEDDNISVRLAGQATSNDVYLQQGGSRHSQSNDINVRVGNSDDNLVAALQTGKYNDTDITIRQDSDDNSVVSNQVGFGNKAELTIHSVSIGNSVLTDQRGISNTVRADIDYSWENEIGVEQRGAKNKAVLDLYDADYNFIAVAQAGLSNFAKVDLDTDGGTVSIHQHGINNKACSSSTGTCSYTN